MGLFAHLNGRRRKQAQVLYSKSTYWRMPLRLLESTFAIGRAACRGSLLDFGVFPDLEGGNPDLDNHFQKVKIALLALDLH